LDFNLNPELHKEGYTMQKRHGLTKLEIIFRDALAGVMRKGGELCCKNCMSPQEFEHLDLAACVMRHQVFECRGSIVLDCSVCGNELPGRA
jgi:hypothetical protein